MDLLCMFNDLLCSIHHEEEIFFVRGSINIMPTIYVCKLQFLLTHIVQTTIISRIDKWICTYISFLLSFHSMHWKWDVYEKKNKIEEERTRNKVKWDISANSRVKMYTFVFPNSTVDIYIYLKSAVYMLLFYYIVKRKKNHHTSLFFFSSMKRY